MSTKKNTTSVMMHSFSVDDAIAHGVEIAVILYNLRFWLEKNKANKKHLHDGYYWTYNSAEAFVELFPYFNRSKVQRLLTKMENDGLVLSGNYNKVAYDRTKWYSMNEFKNEQSIVQKCTMESSEVNNRKCNNEQPIPDNKPDSKPDVNTHTTDSVCETKNEVSVIADEKEMIANQLFEKWLELSSQRIKSSKKRINQIKARLKDGFTIEQITLAMHYVATDSWHVANGFNTIEIAVRSTEQLETKLIKAAAMQNKSNNQNQGSNHDNSQSQSTSNIAQLRAQIASEQAAKQADDQYDQEIRTVC